MVGIYTASAAGRSPQRVTDDVKHGQRSWAGPTGGNAPVFFANDYRHTGRRRWLERNESNLMAPAEVKMSVVRLRQWSEVNRAYIYWGPVGGNAPHFFSSSYGRHRITLASGGYPKGPAMRIMLEEVSAVAVRRRAK
jgi:hypothetical protein